MTRKILLETLKRFESNPALENGSPVENDLVTIKNDLNRLGFTEGKLQQTYIVYKLYLFILRKTFNEFPISYIQGMIEIALVILNAYFKDAVGPFRVKYSDMDEVVLPPQITVDLITEADEKIFEEFLSKNRELYERFRSTTVNIMKQRYLVLVDNSFSKYLELNEIFVKMMNTTFKRNMNSHESIRYMGHIMTFFTRLAGNEEVTYRLLNLILNSDFSMLFSIAAVYIDAIDSFDQRGEAQVDEDIRRAGLVSVDEKDIKRILEMQELFLKFKRDSTSSSGSFGAYLLLGSAIGVGAVILGLAFSEWRSSSK